MNPLTTPTNAMSKLEQLEQSATPAPWKFKLIGHSWETERLLVADDAELSPTDVELIEYLRNLAPELIALWKASYWIINHVSDPHVRDEWNTLLDALEQRSVNHEVGKEG